MRRSGGMKIIPRNIHGMLDYPVGLLLAASPWLFGFAGGGPATTIPVVLGLGALVYSLLTAYELGVARIIPFRVHLAIDFISGLFLAVSPWLFNFSHRVYWPHLIFGLWEMLVVLLTRAEPVPAAAQMARR
jgi:SPW repeat